MTACCSGKMGLGEVGAGGATLPMLLLFLLLLLLVTAYCCWGAPCRRLLCRPRPSTPPSTAPRVRRRHETDGFVETMNGVAGDGPAGPVRPGCSPTIILLPQGHMLVVDGSVLGQLQADNSGLDLIRLGENLVRAQRRQIPTGSTVGDPAFAAGTLNILDVDFDGVGKEGRVSPGVRGQSPPTYESLFGLALQHHIPQPNSGPAPEPLQPPSYDELLRSLPAIVSPSTLPPQDSCNVTVETGNNDPFRVGVEDIAAGDPNGDVHIVVQTDQNDENIRESQV